MNVQDDNKNPDENTFVNDNPDTANQSDNRNTDDLDSPINKDFDKKSNSTASLTNDESADTDPNEVADKPTFKNDNH